MKIQKYTATHTDTHIHRQTDRQTQTNIHIHYKLEIFNGNKFSRLSNAKKHHSNNR